MKRFISMLLAGGVALGVSLAPIQVTTSGLAVAEAMAQSRPAPQRGGPAAAGRDPAGKVSVDLMVIYAHKNDNRVDPALRDVMPQLRSLPFTGYKLLENHASQLAVGQESLVPLPSGKKVKVHLLQRTETQAKVRIRLVNGDKVDLDTTVSIPRDKSFIIAGPSYQGGKLVIPVSVEY